MLMRSAFLATGLVPYTPPSNSGDECAICGWEHTDPRSLPCGHYFDRHCIEKWLNMDNKNTCPMCKAVLFELGEPVDQNFGVDRQALVDEALRISGLNQGDVTSSIDKFGASPPTIPALQQAITDASHFLVQVPRANDSESGSGPATIRVKNLVASFVAMGNLVPALASAQGRQYNLQQVSDWNLVLTQLWYILKRMDGKTVGAPPLAAKLRKEIKKQLTARYSDADFISFLFVYADPSRANYDFDDLETVLRYLTLCCWRQHRIDEAKKARKFNERTESCTVM